MQLTVGKKIRALRKKQNITQEKLAEYLGISFQAVSRWEHGTAYPDITLLPRIANFFGISMDCLFGMDSIDNSEEQAELQQKYEKLIAQNDTKNAIVLMKKALLNYPRDYRFMLNLSSAIREEVKTSLQIDQIALAIQLCERILEDCTNTDIRYGAIQQLCYLYRFCHESEKAKDLIDKLPSTPICKDILLENILNGDELGKQLDTNLDHFMFYIWLKLQKTPTLKGNLNTDERIRAQKAAIQLYKLVYYDGQYGWFSNRLASNYIELSKIYAENSDQEKTLENLSHAIYYAKEYQRSFTTEITTDSIFRYNPSISATYVNDKEKDSLLREIEKLIRTDAFCFLQPYEEFQKLKAELGN